MFPNERHVITFLIGAASNAVMILQQNQISKACFHSENLAKIARAKQPAVPCRLSAIVRITARLRQIADTFQHGMRFICAFPGRERHFLSHGKKKAGARKSWPAKIFYAL
ncbi:MAG: hypothetical protein PHO66_02775 [Eubacteriales bacterium]|nr:hypothetical protein [Eubacteriales bacterium]